MIQNLFGMISKAISTPKTTAIAPVKPKSINPFVTKSTNPFMLDSEIAAANYGKNKPVRGGYFAGYYNGKPNIVGRKLFLEV